MNEVTSPFKFLDSYQQEDSDIFFGREKETNALYNALSGVKHLLVYGPSGAGKTSLIECGLRNQFSDADWYALTIRRGANMTGSVFYEINEALQENINLDPVTRLPLDPDTDFGQAIEHLFSERYQPVYLLFDQFEELLISDNDAEKRDFFTRLNQLIRYKVPCRVILIMREEFIGHLSEFESLCPSIFQHRFRLEKMRRENVKEVIHQTLDTPQYRKYFQVGNSRQLAESILSKLPDKSREIELAHVQVFLSELWDRANKQKKNDALPTLHKGLIKEQDNLTGVLDSFLKKQLEELSQTYGKKIPMETLAAMISERHTKLQMSGEDLQKDLEGKEVALKSSLPNLLHDLEQRRILRTLKSGDQTQYEISHDVLALVVGQNLTEEMKLREKAIDIYRVYDERKGYFSQEDLDFIRPYEQYKAYPATLEKRLKASEDYLYSEALRIQLEKDEQLAAAKRQAEQEKGLREQAEQAKTEAETQRGIAQQNEKQAKANEQRARQRTRLAAFFSIITLALALLAGWSYLQSNKAREEANLSENEAEKQREEALRQKSQAETAKIAADSSSTIAILRTKEAKEALIFAEKSLRKAQAEERKAKNALEQIIREKMATEEQRRIAEGNFLTAQEKAKEAKQAYSLLTNNYLEQGKELILTVEGYLKRLDYYDALKNCEEGLRLGVPADSVKNYIQEISFFYLNSRQTPNAIEALKLLFPKQVFEDSSILAKKIKNINENNFEVLSLKYYPELITIEGGIIISGNDLYFNLNNEFKQPIYQYLNTDTIIKKKYNIMPWKNEDLARDKSQYNTLKSFQIGITEITNWQYYLYTSEMSLKIIEPNFGYSGDLPALNISWLDAIKYCNWLSIKKGMIPYYKLERRSVSQKLKYEPPKKISAIVNVFKRDREQVELITVLENKNSDGYRLPKFIEWEFCAKDGYYPHNLQEFPNSIDSFAWYSNNSNKAAKPVSTKQPNKLGIYDLFGNALEWNNDDWRRKTNKKILVGGSFIGVASECNLNFRYYYDSNSSMLDTGFRIARTNK